MESNKLPEDFKAKWIAALRSGQYHQGTGSLYDDFSDSYCCLGVAGVVCGMTKDELKDRVFVGPNEPDYARPNELFPSILIHPSLEDDLSLVLSRMNDDGKSFSEIADYIETNL